MGDMSGVSTNGRKKNASAEVAQNMPDQASAAKSAPAHKVLIIEDTTELAEVIQITLERLNLKVFHETHGDKALAIYEAEHPDLIVLDIALPDTNGWKVLDTIREQQHGTKTPIIIVITAYGDPANRLMGKLQGIYDYLIKPFGPDDIEKVVTKALNLPKL